MRLLSKILITSIFASLLVVITGTSPAVAAAPTAPTAFNITAIPAAGALWAGVVLNGSAVSGVTLEATTGPTNSPTVAGSCIMQFGETRAQIVKRCKIGGLVDGTDYNLRAKLSNSAGESQFVWSSSGGPPEVWTPSSSAVQFFTASADCSVRPELLRPCANANVVTPMVMSGQNLQACTLINSAGGTAVSIAVTPSQDGTSISLTIPPGLTGFATFNNGCGLGQYAAFFSSPVGSLGQQGYSPTWSSNSGSTDGGSQVTLTTISQFINLFVGVTSVTLGGNPVTYEVVDTQTMRLTVPAGLAGPANLVMTNSNGTGTQGGAYTYIAPPQPGKPDKPTAIAGAGSATITPAPGSGGTPSSYLVLASPGGLTCTVTLPATSCQITGLTNGTPYTFTTAATNAGGTSISSEASDPVTPTAPPSPRPPNGSGSNSPAPTPMPEITPPSRGVIRAVFPGFAPNSTKLTQDMRQEVRSFLKANLGLNQVTCRGFTSAPATPQDRVLARERGKVTCDFIKKLRPEADITIRSGSHTDKPGVQVRRVQIILR